MGRSRSVVITCEHGGYEVPKAYQYLFRDLAKILMSHEGWDPGALEIARYLTSKSNSFLFYSTTSRLLIEANRSENNKQLFSRYSQSLNGSVKKYILQKYYHTYRVPVEDHIKNEIESGKEVVHFSIHTFTPQLNGKKRETDLGILFDNSRKPENRISENCIKILKDRLPDLRINANQPYAGIDDGFTTHLRKNFPSEDYSGIEIEVNQKFINQAEFSEIKKELLKVIKAVKK